MKRNRVLYRSPPPSTPKRGRPKLHGRRLKLNQTNTLGKPNTLITVPDETGGWIEIAVWTPVHVKTHPHLPSCAIRIRAYRPDGTRRFKRPMWLLWTGSPDMEWATFWKTYLKRFCIESVHHRIIIKG